MLRPRGIDPNDPLIPAQATRKRGQGYPSKTVPAALDSRLRGNERPWSGSN
jgi:hypothetical protein